MAFSEFFSREGSEKNSFLPNLMAEPDPKWKWNSP